MIFPWQQSQWQHLRQARQEQRLPHALLLSGIEGTGKSQFAEAWAHAMLCKEIAADGAACGRCQECRLLQGKTHPSLLTITPEEDSRVIKIDQVRDVSEFVSQTALRGQWRIVIIQPAESMNTHAANALLKTLEEPAPNVLMLLVCHQGARMPATILSRCQRIVFPCPPRQQALDWLKTALKDQTELSAALLLSIANGAPLLALRLIDEEKLAIRKTMYDGLVALASRQGDPVKLAAKFQEPDMIFMMDLMLNWVRDWLACGLNGGELINQDYKQSLLELKQGVGMAARATMLSSLLRLRKQMVEGINLNKQLVMESLFINWMTA